MKLISCDGCGVVLDQDKLPFPTEIYMAGDDSDYEIDTDKAAWDSGKNKWTPFTRCPVCEAHILKD